jgi:xanthine dehydrogenase accessory factor
MIGSRRKARLIFDQFLAEGLATPAQIAQVACPVGLDIDSRSVPEIALSIMAQFVQVRAGILRRLEEVPEADLTGSQAAREQKQPPPRPVSLPLPVSS